MKLLSLTMSALAVQASPQITITENGQAKQVYVRGNGWGEGDKGFGVPHPGGVKLVTRDDGGPWSYYTPKIRKGGKIAYDMDISESGCSCNAAFYLVSMPGKDWNGNPAPSSSGDYYCDAN